MQQYLDHIRKVAPHLTENEHYIVVDGNFANAAFIDGVTTLDKDVVGKLRCDANMRYLYKGPKREGRGRQKTYDGKVDWQDLSRLVCAGSDEGVTLYSGLLNHISFSCNLKVVVLIKQAEGETPCYVILFSTDETLGAWQVYRYYKARFQIEFLFRDAKQFTGLCDAQARDQARLDFHFNASLTTLNLAKSECFNAKKKDETRLWSMGSVKILAFNQPMVRTKLSGDIAIMYQILILRRLAEFERDYILKVLKATNWRIKGVHGAAALLGLHPATLYGKMRKQGIKRPEKDHI